MKTIFLTTLLFVTSCCNTPAVKTYHAVGYVRSLYCQTTYCTTVFEGEDKVVFSIPTVDRIPPVWVGLHAEITYEDAYKINTLGHFKNLQVVKRLQ